MLPPPDSTDVDSTSAAETLPPERTLDLPDTDFGGREFRVLGLKNDTYSQFNNFEIYAESENGDVVNDAVYRRNESIRDKYNVIIAQTLVDNPSGDIEKLISADEHQYDLMFDTHGSLGSIAQKGYLWDLYNVKYIDFSKDWWNHDIAESLTVEGRLFCAASDFSLRDKSSTWMLVYNMKLAEDFSIPYLPDLVREKKWTIDTMNSYVKQVADDLTGDGEMRPVDDRWGLVMGALTSFPTFVIGCGNRVMTNDPQNGLQLSMNTERMVNSIDKVLDLTCDLNYSFFCDDWKGKVDYDHYSTASYTFYANNALFQTTVPYSLKNLSAKCDFDYCILPFPMYDENQDKYYTLPDWTAHLFGIPASCKDPDFAGFMLEALSAASTDTTLKAYYETACKVKYNYVQDSIDMLDTVFDGIVLDPSMVYNIGNIYSIIRENIPSKRKNNFASLYASREPAAQKALDKFKETIKEIQ